MGLVLILGGVRSGKSGFAVRLGEASRKPVTFIATATAGDEEMSARIRLHRETRPQTWKTIEAPLDVLSAIRGAPHEDFVILDCLTLWVSNLLEVGRTPDDITRLSDQVVQELVGRHSAVVSNEVGMGVVPANQLARTYTEVLGAVNTRFAKCAERALLMVAGAAFNLTPA